MRASTTDSASVIRHSTSLEFHLHPAMIRMHPMTQLPLSGSARLTLGAPGIALTNIPRHRWWAGEVDGDYCQIR